MGLLSTTNRFYQTDNRSSIHVDFPKSITVIERKAPTDASIRLMEEMHDKAIENIIAKVKVENNLVNGECFCVNQPWDLNDVKLYFKFKINDREFTIESEVSRHDIGWDESKDIDMVAQRLGDYGKSVMLWYALKMFAAHAYEKISGHKIPEEILIKKILK